VHVVEPFCACNNYLDDIYELLSMNFYVSCMTISIICSLSCMMISINCSLSCMMIYVNFYLSCMISLCLVWFLSVLYDIC
jgi:hypothetical protein